MNLAPLLDMWDRPAAAGDPVAVLATTFTLEPEFFENNCLARFLAVDAVDEGTKSIDDIVARVEMEEALRLPAVTVLADRRAQCERTSLRWDLLPVAVPTGLLHSKVAIILWEKATRVIVGSANLTEAGYRRNIEIGLAADLGPSCLFPGSVLNDIADQVESYLDYLGVGQVEIPAVRRARETLALFRDRAADQTDASSQTLVACAPTAEGAGPLDALRLAWRGKEPTQATHVSPFWDKDNDTVLTAVHGLLQGRPAATRRHTVSAAVGLDGAVAFPLGMQPRGVEVCRFDVDDGNVRSLHAKSLVIRSAGWVSALVGSSNHTRAGLGLGGPRRHRELNIWLGAATDTPEGKVLLELDRRGAPVPDGTAFEPLLDEDEPEDVAVLPLFFGLCRVGRAEDGSWQVITMFDPLDKLAAPWSVHRPDGAVLVDDTDWGGRAEIAFPVAEDALPVFLTVRWGNGVDGGEVAWSTIVDDRHDLPPGLEIAGLSSQQLLAALAAGKSLAQAVREELERSENEDAPAAGEVELDLLRLHDSSSALLRRGRALAVSLDRLQIRLSRPVLSLDNLSGRLRGPYGPSFIVDKVVSDWQGERITAAEAMFTVAEIALAVARVPWFEVFAVVDADEGITQVRADLERLVYAAAAIDADASDVGRYLTVAIQEARRCLN
ncbi:MAG: hypothetical protein QM658_05110 [Gordonia sp. (in: high G+C Gram-positive bacteria)]